MFCIPAGSADSERAFSAAGWMFDEDRARMSPETLKMLVVIHSFIKSDRYSFKVIFDKVMSLMKKENP